jgi:hypothetical protein
VKDAETDRARLSSTLVLGQLLLLRKKHREYAELAAGTVAPLLVKLQAPRATGQEEGLLETQETLGLVGTLGLLPLFVPEFLGGLPHEQLRGLIPRWEALGKSARGDTARLWADLFLSAAHRQLGQDDERRAADRRVRGNPRAEVLPKGGVAEWVRVLRAGAAELRPGTRSRAERELPVSAGGATNCARGSLSRPRLVRRIPTLFVRYRSTTPCLPDSSSWSPWS